MKTGFGVVMPITAILLVVASVDVNLAAAQSPMKEFGVFFGPIQQHTGVYHNDNGVFVPWSTLCKAEQAYLLQSCSTLINPDGSLTTSGQTAVGCITNGAIITVLAAKFNLQNESIKGILDALTKPTGCSGIVDLNSIPNSPDIKRLVDLAASAAVPANNAVQPSESPSFTGNMSGSQPSESPSFTGNMSGSQPSESQSGTQHVVPSGGNSVVTIVPGSSSPDNEKFFDPPTLKIAKGTTVTWKNADYTLHTVTSGTAEGAESGTIFDSSHFAPGKTFEFRFDRAGIFDYYCTLHPYMKGKIIVN
jgi:plastocyanin